MENVRLVANGIEKVLLTWCNSQEKAEHFYNWVLKTYNQRKVTIEEDAAYGCYYIYLYIHRDESGKQVIVTMVQRAIEDNPTSSQQVRNSANPKNFTK